jgi:hypothetical protein
MEDKWVQNEHLIDNTTDELVINLKSFDSGKSRKDEYITFERIIHSSPLLSPPTTEINVD